MKMKKKKNNSNPPYEEKLATTCAPKIQKKKSIEKSKGKCIMEHMDVAEATFHFNYPFQDDVIMEIHYRLPFRDLLQFKYVSKLRNALISDPYFVNKHRDRAKNDPHSQKLLIYQRSLTDPTTSIYSCPLSSSLQLVNKIQKLDSPSSSIAIIHCTYNGLAVIRVFTPATYKNSGHILSNPSTRESILLPQPIFPVQTGYSLGLGCDSTSGDYKILNIRSRRPVAKYLVKFSR
ncbi:putative F-box protein At1g50870 [Capsicum annuum]|uniref:putative F-box protein At1g50870 n=1 Tax=Capsicum annuum TaxID=4072 RepID=UPI001FB19640|nr:putative F-box protein At1g50870 [Capsicum annuum]